MRKDYIVSTGLPIDETTFVEEYWTKVWERIDEKAKRPDDVAKTEEYGVIAPYLATLQPGARILDGGCGLGEFVAYFHSKGFEPVGVDLSRKTIALLQQKYPAMTFTEGDIRNLSFGNDSFDAYFSWGVFEHFEAGPGACIREAFRILKPGGLLFITVPFDNFRQALRGVLERAKPATAGARFYQWRFTRAELAREITACGFNIEKLQTISKQEGVSRLLHHDIGLPFEWFATKALRRLLTPVVPAGFVAHMLMAVARKPVADQIRQDI
jgi:SAM-dependent methyltransferase